MELTFPQIFYKLKSRYEPCSIEYIPYNEYDCVDCLYQGTEKCDSKKIYKVESYIVPNKVFYSQLVEKNLNKTWFETEEKALEVLKKC